MSTTVVSIKNVSKVYKLYNKPMDRLKESLNLTRKKCYKEHYALRNVSFDINKGQTVGIIGTNGSGKSTILKIITGVLTQTSGEVNIQGRISALLELGAGFNMEYTGIENVYLNGTMLGFTKEEIDQKLEDILSFADIGDFVNQPVKTYSSGMFVRLAFAVAINIEPEILIVDEALSVGDVFFQAKCYKKFEEFKKQGRTILFVSHDLGSIAKYCDKVILLNQGTKIEEGSPKEMIDLYKKLLVNQLNQTPEEEKEEEKDEIMDETQLWKSKLEINPNIIKYGSKKAEIVDFALINQDKVITNTIDKGEYFKIKMKVKFHEMISDPIFAYTIKDLKGTEITGTNTMYERSKINYCNAGDVRIITFEQQLNLQGGNYLISFGCTGFEDGEFTVYERLYDACNLTVISDKDTVGFYDMNSQIVVE